MFRTVFNAAVSRNEGQVSNRHNLPQHQLRDGLFYTLNRVAIMLATRQAMVVKFTGNTLYENAQF